jgi:radical SAM protein with 4Fe4S-binding SPASM domain
METNGDNMKRIREYGRVPLEKVLPLDTPFVINVDPSSICNFKCKYCFQASNKLTHKGVMTWSTYSKILSNIHKFPSLIKTLRLYAFGEPLVNPLFFDMVKIAKDLHISEDIDTTTNGSLLNPDLNLKIIKAGIDRINISVMGVNSKHYKQFAQYTLDFERYVDNIAHLYNNRDNCIIFVKINGDMLSKDDQQRFIDIFTPISSGCAIEHVMDCWYDCHMEGVERNKNVGVYGQPLTHVDVCPYIFYSFCVQYDGEVSACFLDWNRKLILGNIHQNSLKEIWEGEPLKTLRRVMLLKKRYEHPICNNCNQLEAGEPVNIDHLADKLLKVMYD